MNGRVYDPVLARFLRSDPVVSDPFSAQTYNGYSYVDNNPAGATDPSGYNALVVNGQSYSVGGGGPNYPNLNFNSGGGSNGFSLFGGNVSFTFGGGDPFNNRWGPAYPIGPLMQAQYMSRFGASSVFTGLPNVVDGNSYLRSANSGRGGSSAINSAGLSYSDQSNLDYAKGFFVDGAWGTVKGLGVAAWKSSPLVRPFYWREDYERMQYAINTPAYQQLEDMADAVGDGLTNWVDGLSTKRGQAALVFNAASFLIPWSKVSKLSKIASTDEISVVIGENVKRTRSYAARKGYQVIDDWLKAEGRVWDEAANADWMKWVKQRGYNVIDIGPDFGRRLDYLIDPLLPSAKPPSLIYGSERRAIRDYPRYQKNFQRAGKYNGSVKQ